MVTTKAGTEVRSRVLRGGLDGPLDRPTRARRPRLNRQPPRHRVAVVVEGLGTVHGGASPEQAELGPATLIGISPSGSTWSKRCTRTTWRGTCGDRPASRLQLEPSAVRRCSSSIHARRGDQTNAVNRSCNRPSREEAGVQVRAGADPVLVRPRHRPRRMPAPSDPTSTGSDVMKFPVTPVCTNAAPARADRTASR